MFAFTWAIDNTTHDRDFQALYTGVLLTPHRHFVAQKHVDFLCEFLESGAGGSSAARASGDTGHKTAQPQSLQNFGRNQHLLGASFTRLRGERHTDGVTNAFLQQQTQGHAGCGCALNAHACLSESQMKRMVGSFGKFAVDRHQVLYAAHLAAENDLMARQA